MSKLLLYILVPLCLKYNLYIYSTVSEITLYIYITHSMSEISIYTGPSVSEI